MLHYEEEYTKSQRGQDMYRNPLNKPFITLNVEKTINRIVLNHFGYNTEDSDVETYRTIFRTYFRSPDDYDKEVIELVHYMRENRCVYYKSKPMKINDIIPDCTLYKLDGKTKINMYEIINKKRHNYTVVAAFSLS